jgi:hypothetical protein
MEPNRVLRAFMRRKKERKACGVEYVVALGLKLRQSCELPVQVLPAVVGLGGRSTSADERQMTTIPLW